MPCLLAVATTGAALLVLLAAAIVLLPALLLLAALAGCFLAASVGVVPLRCVAAVSLLASCVAIIVCHMFGFSLKNFVHCCAILVRLPVAALAAAGLALFPITGFLKWAANTMPVDAA
jgi:hypothetical protein